jgi:hypothetical protein
MAELSAYDQAELSDIGFYWGGAYRAWHNGETYCAVRKGESGHVVTADTPRDLRREICRDYGAWLASIRQESMSL